MKKAMRKLIPAVIMLLISAMLVGTSTYAWFSMNKTVTVTGMTVKAKGSDNVTISADDSVYTFGLNQSRAGELKPVSSVDGISFFWNATNNVDSSTGNAVSNDYTAYNEDTNLTNNAAGKTQYDDGFNENYDVEIASISTSTVVYGYIDYQFYINATNSKGTSQYLNMDRCNLLYNYATTEIKAWRVAVFANETTHGSASHTEINTTDLKSILRLSGAQYFGDSVADADEAVSGGSAITAVNAKIDDAANIATLTAGQTRYYAVTVRLWLEGEDKTCNNATFANLSSDWTLDISFSLADATGGVANIGSAAVVNFTTDTGNTRVVALNVSGETAAHYQWYKANGDTVGTDSNTFTAESASDDGQYYCVITTTKGSVYRSGLCTAIAYAA